MASKLLGLSRPRPTYIGCYRTVYVGLQDDKYKIIVLTYVNINAHIRLGKNEPTFM
jgi:hypothetical protein